MLLAIFDTEKAKPMDHRIKQLDAVLESLLTYSRTRRDYVLAQDLNTEYDLGLDPVSITAICHKLHEDGYASKSHLKKNGEYLLNYPTFFMSYNGLIFMENGGYMKRVRRNRFEYRRKFILDSFLILGAIGALVISIPIVLSFIDYLFP